MHILFLTDNFPPEVNAPASRTFEHCREWVKVGHQVTVVTTVPNFPTGKVFGGYRNKWWQAEQMAGIRVIRVWSYVVENTGFAKRVLDYLSFMLMAIPASLLVRKVDVVVGTSPQFFTACAAYAVGALKRAPWVFELRDIWPESIRVVGAMKDSVALDLLEKLELFLYRKATMIVSVTNAHRDNLIGRGIERSKIQVVTNGVDIDRFLPCAKDASLVSRYGLEDKFVAGYIGTLGLAHGLDTVLDAAKLMAAAADGDRFRFVLLGDGAQKATLMARARAEGLGNLIFVDSVPKDEVVRYWSMLDVAVIHLKSDDLFKTVIPSKMFESMGMAIPLLHGVQGESAEILEREDVGILFEPENPDALCKGLRRLSGDESLYRRLRANGPIAARNYDRNVLAARLLRLLEAAAGRSQTGPALKSYRSGPK